MNIGFALKLIRIKMAITQGELAKKSNFTQTSISQIETGKKKPTKRTLAKLCSALEIPESIVYIIGMEEMDMPESKKNIFHIIYPSMQELALQLVEQGHTIK